MKIKTKILIVAGIATFIFSKTCYADELPELKAQMKAMQKQINELTKDKDKLQIEKDE